ncbi:uncharacterized protein BXZ73DRAFT_75746 [Epithele typhae]|uniref:uncharacterized protein n=1 Tax=Epithele typhae TaxID=378194 RepID=UPI0020072C64|nr:uncharacterized protein BXZ73DRAFT_75746 [Epithele typhae]KAH9940140.1 hypothetical protein BXZ73DRAFT_75746 [Epithele typhae]
MFLTSAIAPSSVINGETGHSSASSPLSSSTWKEDDIKNLPAQLPNLQRLVLSSRNGTYSQISAQLLTSTLLNAHTSLDYLVLDGVDLPKRSFNNTLFGIQRSPAAPVLHHLKAVWTPTCYIRGFSGVLRPDIHLFLDALTTLGLISRQTLLTLDLPHYWKISEHWQSDVYATLKLPSLEIFGIMLSHSQHNNHTVDDGTHLRTRELLDALAPCARLRALHITYGEPELREWYSLRREHLSAALICFLRDHFSRTPPAHPHLEELKLTVAYWAKDVKRAWSPVISQLAAVLCDRARYPSFRRLHVCKLVAINQNDSDRSDLDAARRIVSGLFSAFAVPGVELIVDAEFLFGDTAEKEDMRLDSDADIEGDTGMGRA